MAALSLAVLLTALCSLSLSRSAGATSILLPLYVYPSDSLSSWTPLFNALSAHPSVKFTIIINPDSGPGNFSTIPDTQNGKYPVSNYRAGISRLHTYPNARLIGYVHTLYTQAPLATLESNITKFANWSGYSGGANISMQGIFFDEAPADDSAASLQYMASAAAFARRAIPGASVVYNPGRNTSAAYFSPAPPDLSVQCERASSDWAGNATIAGFPRGWVARSAALLHNVPSAAVAQTIARQCAAAGVGAVYAAQSGDYSDLSYVETVASALNS